MSRINKLYLVYMYVVLAFLSSAHGMLRAVCLLDTFKAMYNLSAGIWHQASTGSMSSTVVNHFEWEGWYHNSLLQSNLSLIMMF